MVHVGRRGSPFGTSADRRPSASSPSRPVKVRTSERGRKVTRALPKSRGHGPSSIGGGPAAPPPPSPAGTETLRPIPRTATAGPAVTSSAMLLNQSRRPPTTAAASADAAGPPMTPRYPLAAASNPTGRPETSKSVSAPRLKPTWPSPARAPVTSENSRRNRPGSRAAPFAAAALADTTGAGPGATARAAASAGFAARAGCAFGAPASAVGNRSNASSVGTTSSRRDTERDVERPSGSTTSTTMPARSGNRDPRAGVDVVAAVERARMRAGRSGHRALTSVSASTATAEQRVRRRSAGWCRSSQQRGEACSMSRSRAHGLSSIFSEKAEPFIAFLKKTPRRPTLGIVMGPIFAWVHLSRRPERPMSRIQGWLISRC